MGLNTQRYGKPLNIVQCNIPSLAFNMSDKCAVQSALESKSLLRPSFAMSKENDVAS
jgi:hypothetical protein